MSLILYFTCHLVKVCSCDFLVVTGVHSSVFSNCGQNCSHNRVKMTTCFAYTSLLRQFSREVLAAITNALFVLQRNIYWEFTMPLRFVNVVLAFGGKNLSYSVSNARKVTWFAFFCIDVEHPVHKLPKQLPSSANAKQNLGKRMLWWLVSGFLIWCFNFCCLKGPAHYLTKEKPKSKEDQPSSTFVSATGRLHTPQGVVLVSVAHWSYLTFWLHTLYTNIFCLIIFGWQNLALQDFCGNCLLTTEFNLCFFVHQDNPPPGSYEVGHSYDSTQGTCS